MRLQLIAATLATLSLASPTWAQSTTTNRVDVYSDGDITVISPSTRTSVSIGDKMRVEGGYAVDIVSGATRVVSTDLVSSATTFDEVRHQPDLLLTVLPSDRWTVGFALAAGLESDYTTVTFGPSMSVELFGKMSTLSVSYMVAHESWGLSSGEPVEDRARGHTLNVGWTQLLSRTRVLTIQLTGMFADCGDVLGCQANPYRFVPLGTNQTLATVRERHPGTRYRGAARVQLAQVLTRGLALQAGYRFYGDSWEILGHTADLALAATLLDDRLLLRASGRFVWQGAASFFAERYPMTVALGEVPRYRTADQELSSLYGGMVSLRVAWSFLALGPLLRLEIGARVAHHWYQYPEFDARPERNAWIVGGGLRVEL